MINRINSIYARISRNQVKAGVVLSYVVLGLSNITGLLYTPYMLRMLGQSEYGLWALVSSVIGYLTILDFGFGNAVIRFTSKFRAEGKFEEQYSMFGMFIILYSLIGFLALIFGYALYLNTDALFSDSMTLDELRKAKIMIALMIFNLVISFPLSVFGSIISAYEDFVFQKLVQIIRILLSTAVLILILEIGYRAIGMVVVTTIFNILTLFANYQYCKSKLKIKIFFKTIDWSLLQDIGVYSMFIFLNIIIDKIYWNSGQFILGVYLGTTAVAVFAIAVSLQNMYKGFSMAIGGVLLPRVTAMVATNKSNKELSELFIRTGRLQFIIIGFILSGYIVFGKQFVIIWAGEEYKDAYLMALLLFIGLSIPLIQTLGMIILQARNQLTFRSLVYFLLAIISLSIQIPLVKDYGGLGVSVTICTAFVIGHGLIMNIYYYKKQGLDIPKFWKQILKMAVTPALLAILAYFTVDYLQLSSPIELGLGIVIYTIAYVPLFWVLSMNTSERELFGFVRIPPFKR